MDRKRKKSKPKKKKATLREKNEQRKLSQLAKEGRVVKGQVIPPDAIPADPSQQASNNSYSAPLYYRDIEFMCSDCGVSEVWKAKDQKWYFEVVKGSIYSGPKRCRACRMKLRAMKAVQRQQMDVAKQSRREKGQGND